MRLFLGLSLPDSIADALVLKQNGLPDTRWQPRENLHITLRFLDNVDQDRAEALDMALASITMPGFELKLDGFDYFSNQRHGRLLYARVAHSNALHALHNKVEQVARHCGIDLKHEKYTPHITLARLRRIPVESVENWLANQGIWYSPPWTVTAFHLFSSQVSHHGARYSMEADYPLEARAPSE